MERGRETERERETERDRERQRELRLINLKHLQGELGFQPHTEERPFSFTGLLSINSIRVDVR